MYCRVSTMSIISTHLLSAIQASAVTHSNIDDGFVSLQELANRNKIHALSTYILHMAVKCQIPIRPRLWLVIDQHEIVNHLKSIIRSKQTDKEFENISISITTSERQNLEDSELSYRLF